MKLINAETAAKSVVSWIYDFRNDYNRFPDSLDDLADNKADKHSYNPRKALELHRKLGFNTEYRLSGGIFEITVIGQGKSVVFSSASKGYTVSGKQTEMGV